MKKYDYLIVGAGLFGAVFAYEAMKRGKTCLVIERRNHIAGNIYCETIEDIHVHKYGAHIFHTSNQEVWNYINQFAEFNNYINSPIAIYKDELYNLPFNMNTFSKMWNIRTPQEAKNHIAQQIAALNITEPKNLEEQALSLVGTDVYEKLIKGYTEKQWGRNCTDLPSFIIKRLPLRFTYDNNYFNDRYQGIPIGGYTPIVEKMLAGADILTNTDYFEFIKEHPDVADKTVFTGQIDAFFDYKLGVLEYRSVRFETEVLDCENYQGNAVVNYTSTLNSASSRKPSSPENILPNGRRAMNRIIRSTTNGITRCIRNIRSWQKPFRMSSLAAVWVSISIMTWMRLLQQR